MILFFDTETTGLPKNWNAPIEDINNWPRLVQLAFMYYTNEGLFIGSYNFIVKPDGYSIPSEVSNINGITTERANREGMKLNKILDEFRLAVNISSIVVAHNMEFDEKIIGCEYYRMGEGSPLEAKSKFCTMKNPEVVNFCAISPFKYGTFKWPSLSELHYKLFNSGFEEAHNAEFDIKATANCFWELKKRGIITSTFIDFFSIGKIGKLSNEKINNRLETIQYSGDENQYLDSLFEITRPMPDERLQVARGDFEKRMNWFDANKACEELGDGWRLPTISELDFMIRKFPIAELGGFRDDIYWSSSEYKDYVNPNHAYFRSFYMEGGDWGIENKEERFLVRAVRTKLILKCPHLIQVALRDFNNRMYLDEAKRACQELGEGWRLPTINELVLIFKEFHLAGKGDFKNDYYWSDSTELDEHVGVGGALTLNFISGHENADYGFLDKYSVRAVRDL